MTAKGQSNEGSPLTKKELLHFQQLLLDKRREIVGDVNNIVEEALKKSRAEAHGDLSQMPIHMADIGSDNYEQEFSLELMDSERKLLKQIDQALVRMSENRYGICLGTGEAIPKPRLEAVPWAKYSISFAEKLEKGQVEEPEVD